MFIPLGPLNIPQAFSFGLPLGPSAALIVQEHNESVSNNVAFTQIVTRTIEESVSNSITFTSEGHGGFGGENTVTFGQAVSTAGSVFNGIAENNVSFGQNANPAGSVFNVVAANIIVFTVIGYQNTKDGIAENTVIFGSTVNEINKFVAGTNVIAFGQSVAHNQKYGVGSNLIIFGFSVEHNQVEEEAVNDISFDQNILSEEPIAVSASNNIVFGQIAGSSIKNVSASNEIVFGQNAARNGSVYVRAADNTVLFTHIGARSFSESLISTITFTPTAVSHPNGTGVNTIIFTPTATGFATKWGQSDLVFGQQVVATVVRAITVSNDIKFVNSMGLFGIDLNFDEYNPIIDESVKEHQLSNALSFADNGVGTKITNKSGSNTVFFDSQVSAVVIP